MNYSVESRTYGLNDGRKIDSGQWFLAELRGLFGDSWQATRLAKIVSKLGGSQHHKDDAECFGAAEFSVSEVYPSQRGLVFQANLPTPYKFCRGAVDVTVPFAQLTPFLSSEGKRAVKSIERAMAKKSLP
jgi:hypothetical protein